MIACYDLPEISLIDVRKITSKVLLRIPTENWDVFVVPFGISSIDTLGVLARII